MSAIFCEKGSHKARKCFPELSERQFQCLMLYSLGVSYSDIGEKMKCNYQSVQNTMSRMLVKFSVESVTELRMVFFFKGDGAIGRTIGALLSYGMSNSIRAV